MARERVLIILNPVAGHKAAQKALFLSRNGRRISNKTVQAMIYKYLDMAGLGGRGPTGPPCQ